jgi:hypothetical protein
VSTSPLAVPPASESSSGVRRLPMMVVGPGDRQSECRHYDGCLDRFVAVHCRRPGHRGEPDAHCPPGCEAFAVVPQHVHQALAHTYGSRIAASSLE